MKTTHQDNVIAYVGTIYDYLTYDTTEDDIREMVKSDMDLMDDEQRETTASLFEEIVEEALREAKEKAYTVYFVGGERDGEELAKFGSETEAVDFARQYSMDHEADFDPVCGGVAIEDPFGETVIDW